MYGTPQKAARKNQAFALAALLASACAQGQLGEPDVDPPPDAEPFPDVPVAPDAGPPPPGLDASPQIVASDCPDGEFATGVGADGRLECAPIDAVAKAALEDDCDLYVGWANDCDGCTGPLEKWGRSGGDDCSVGTGTNCTCTAPNLDGRQVSLFGLNPDGIFAADDTLFVGFRCEAPADPPSSTCGAGQFLVSSSADGIECVTARGAITASLQSSCELYYGYREDCSGCSDPPVFWGRVGSNGCTVGAGADTTCSESVLGGVSVHLLGINPPDAVQEPDKFYVGLRCSAPGGGASINETTCPAGQLVVGIDQTGQVLCASPTPRAHDVIASSCSVYHGQRDRCDGCTDPPEKWGRTNADSCENGLGADNTCSVAELGGASVRLFGLDIQGNLSDDDKIYFGTHCQ